MVSPALNVLRWSIFGSGIAYGFIHNQSLQSEAIAKHSTEQYNRKEKWIAEAKAKYAELNKKPTSEVVTDVNDPNFDIEKLIDHALKE